MNRGTSLWAVLVTALGVCVGASTLAAQDDANPRPALRRNAAQQENAANQDRALAGNLDDKTSGASIRASKLIGMDIQSDNGDDVGEIKDIVIDLQSGRVRYAAVSYGGFLGLGDKLFAVPFQALKIQRDPDDQSDYVLVLNVTKEQLEGDKGFDEDNWPNFADTEFTTAVDRRYGVQRRVGRRGRNVEVEVDRNGVDVEVDTDRPETDADRE